MIAKLLSIIIATSSLTINNSYNYYYHHTGSSRLIHSRYKLYPINYEISNYDNDGLLGLPTTPVVTLYDEFDYSLITDDNIENNLIDNKTNSKNKIKDSMRKQLEYAYDNLYESDIEIMMNVIWSEKKENKIINIRLKLIELTKLAESIEKIAMSIEGNYGYENLVEEIRVIRSQIRMYSNVPIIMDAVFTKNPFLNTISSATNDGPISLISTKWKSLISFIRKWMMSVFGRIFNNNDHHQQ